MARNNKTKKKQEEGRSISWHWLVPVVLIGSAVVLFTRGTPEQVSTPPSTIITYDVAMRYLKDYRVDEAERALLSILASHPESARVRDELRWMYFNQFRHRDLEQLLEDGLQLRPYDFSLAVALLMSEFRPQNAREVLRYWERAASHQPPQARVLATLGYCYARTGDTAQARRSFQSALEVGPNDTLVRIRVVEFLIDMGESAAAEQLLRPDDTASTANTLNSKYEDQIWWNRSLLAESNGDLEAALENIERSLERRPYELRYIQRRGTLLQLLGLQLLGLQLLGYREEATDVFVIANQLEAHVGRLTEIVLSGDLDNPSLELCFEISELCQRRGKRLQAEAWQRAAIYLEN